MAYQLYYIFGKLVAFLDINQNSTLQKMVMQGINEVNLKTCKRTSNCSTNNFTLTFGGNNHDTMQRTERILYLMIVSNFISDSTSADAALEC